MKVIFCLEKRYSWKIAAKIVAVAPKYQLEESHLSLTMGNKIATKKRRNSLSGGLHVQR